MHRVSEIIGKPIVSAGTGDRLGRVSDALLSDGGIAVVAVVLGGGLFGTERVLPFQDIQTIGRDTVLARTDSGIRNADEWRRAGVSTLRSSELRGRPVVSAGGQRLGEVSDLLVNDETGAFDGIEVATQHLAGLRTKRVIVPASGEMRIGRDAVIVPEHAFADASGPEHGPVDGHVRQEHGA